MSKQDLENLGRTIQEIVDQAVNSKDYQKLNQTINQTINKAVDMGGETVRRVVDNVFQAEPVTTKASQPKRPEPVQKSKSLAHLYGDATGKTVGGILKVIGGAMLECTAVGAFALSFFPGFGVPMLWRALFAAGGGTVLLANGISNLNWAGRFKKYRKMLGQKTHITLEQLARGVGKSVKFVKKEVLRMTASGMFREGHLNKEETMLITSHETFNYFEQNRLLLEEQKRQAAEEAEQKRKNAPAPHVQEVIDRGDVFLAQIRKCNDEIPGEEISAKISHMEQIVDRIFDRAEKHPEIIPDLKKMMDYYLPMTIKLLKAYADMDAQPVQGENIQNSKREIEATLDTLNLAFEKLLDQVFADTALDVSSDISVLNTLLAQEGLTEDELTKMRKQS